MAKLLAMQTVFGAASLAAESGEEPGELRRQVTSPNGTTAAALAVLMGEDRLKRSGDRGRRGRAGEKRRTGVAGFIRRGRD